MVNRKRMLKEHDNMTETKPKCAPGFLDVLAAVVPLLMDREESVRNVAGSVRRNSK